MNKKWFILFLNEHITFFMLNNDGPDDDWNKLKKRKSFMIFLNKMVDFFCNNNKSPKYFEIKAQR